MLDYTADHLRFLTSTEETIFEGYYYLYSNNCNINTDGMIFVTSDTNKSIGGVYLYSGVSLVEGIYGWFTNDSVYVDVGMLTPVDDTYYVSTYFTYTAWSGLRFAGVYFTSLPNFSEICHISFYHY